MNRMTHSNWPLTLHSQRTPTGFSKNAFFKSRIHNLAGWATSHTPSHKLYQDRNCIALLKSVVWLTNPILSSNSPTISRVLKDSPFSPPPPLPHTLLPGVSIGIVKLFFAPPDYILSWGHQHSIPIAYSIAASQVSFLPESPDGLPELPQGWLKILLHGLTE